jgi:hypothetical protein
MSSKLRSKLLLTAPLLAIVTTAVLSFSNIVFAQTFSQGDHLLAANVTTGVTWRDPLDAKTGDLVEFRMLAQNIDANTTINNVIVKGIIPSTVGTNTLTAQAMVSADNAASFTDSVTLNITDPGMHHLVYAPGHVRIFAANYNGQNCTAANGCPGPDSVATTGVNVGNLGYGESAQVLYKAYIIKDDQASPSPSASPSTSPSASPSMSPSASPSMSPSVSPSPSSGNNLQCPNGTKFDKVEGNNIICILIDQNQTQSQTQNNNQNITITNPAPTSTGAVLGQTIVKELPRTGLPLLAWATMALVPAGYGLKKFGKNQVEDNSESATYIWENREFKKA